MKSCLKLEAPEMAQKPLLSLPSNAQLVSNLQRSIKALLWREAGKIFFFGWMLKIQWNLDITNLYITKTFVERTIFFTPAIVQCMKKNLDKTKPRYSEQILPFPWPFVISRFHSIFFFQLPKLNKYCLRVELAPLHQVIKKLKMDHLCVYKLYPTSCPNGYRMW